MMSSGRREVGKVLPNSQRSHPPPQPGTSSLPQPLRSFVQFRLLSPHIPMSAPGPHHFPSKCPSHSLMFSTSSNHQKSDFKKAVEFQEDTACEENVKRVAMNLDATETEEHVRRVDMNSNNLKFHVDDLDEIIDDNIIPGEIREEKRSRQSTKSPRPGSTSDSEKKRSALSPTCP